MWDMKQKGIAKFTEIFQQNPAVVLTNEWNEEVEEFPSLRDDIPKDIVLQHQVYKLELLNDADVEIAVIKTENLSNTTSIHVLMVPVEGSPILYSLFNGEEHEMLLEINPPTPFAYYDYSRVPVPSRRDSLKKGTYYVVPCPKTPTNDSYEIRCSCSKKEDFTFELLNKL
jgi:hypothetical protein